MRMLLELAVIIMILATFWFLGGVIEHHIVCQSEEVREYKGERCNWDLVQPANSQSVFVKFELNHT